MGRIKQWHEARLKDAWVFLRGYLSFLLVVFYISFAIALVIGIIN